MAHLTKPQRKAHAQACALLAKDVLSLDEREFVLNNWHEAAEHVNGDAGAFFTPMDLAYDFAIDACGRRVIDLCAGIGALAFACYHRQKNGGGNPEVVCVEKNPAYVAVGRKVLPEATWICADVFELPAGLGPFDVAIGNPPFGAVARSGNGPRYTGRDFELHLIDLAADLADYGAFIVPQSSAPFAYSGVQHYREVKSAKMDQFLAQTGIEMAAGCGVDCSYHRDAWKFSAPAVEIVCCDFAEDRQARPAAAKVEQVTLADGPALQLLTPGVEPLGNHTRELAQLQARRNARRGAAPLPAGGLFDETARAQQELF
jgi:hypothetical protein